MSKNKKFTRRINDNSEMQNGEMIVSKYTV